jgi:two-component system, LytTR family, response regulator
MMQKVIIADDEAAGRTLIRQYLQAFPALIVVAEANNGVDAVRHINEFKPDIVFLDIQMPGLTGFEVLKYVEEIPQIIFSTAFDQYAFQAFEVHAVDYLLKPYTLERFKTALQKLRNNKEAGLTPIQTLAETIINPLQYPAKILIQQNQKLITVQVKDIVRIEAEGDYSRIVTEKGQFLSNYGITQLENKLPPQSFVRVHRSAIINLDFIQEIRKQISVYDVVLRNGDVVRVSRGYLDNIRRLKY